MADRRFQPELLRWAQAHGRLPSNQVLPECSSQNLPAMLNTKRDPWSEAGQLPASPFGTDLTVDGLHTVNALKRLKRATQHRIELVTMAVKNLWEGKETPATYLARLGLDDANSFKTMFIRRLLASIL